MTTYTTDFSIKQSDSWVLVATNPSQLIIKPGVRHPYWVAITDTGVPAVTVVGQAMNGDPEQGREPFILWSGVTGAVYVRIRDNPSNDASQQGMIFNVTATTGSGSGGGGGGGTASFETVGPPFVPSGSVTQGSGTITSGGTAQTLFAAGTTPHGWMIQNQSTGDLYIRHAVSATTDNNSIKVPAGFEYVADYTNGSLVSIIGATTGQTFYAEAF